MSRQKRELRRKFEVFCEGDTEYNYINHMRRNQGVELSIKPINMKGGGYRNFLNEVKTKGQVNCLARFIIMDADRMDSNSGECFAFEQLLEYCRQQNKKKGVPCFLILDNPDFEYVACLHADSFSGQPSENFIRDGMGFKSIADFKRKEDVYEFLTSGRYRYENLLTRLKGSRRALFNCYIVKRKSFDVEIKTTVFNKADLVARGSNIDEFFDIIDW
jgi:hypothetical protein